MRYIDADAVLQEVEKLKKSPWYNDDYGFGTKQARQDGVGVVVDLCIKQAPTADVVEVVRCKDCKHYFNGCCYVSTRTNKGCYPRVNVHSRGYDDYCSYGERRGENDR